jgi:hypothetical protein
MSWTYGFQVSLHWTNPLGSVLLQRDPEKVPKGARLNAEWTEDEESRVFVGPATFLEGYERDLEEGIAIWGAVPADLAEHVVAEMGRLGLESFDLGDPDLEVFPARTAPEMDEPLAEVLDALRLLLRVYQTVGGLPHQPGGPAPVEIRGCSYCGTRYNGVRRSGCPNCGAPAEG